jgi:hypothetical protein
VATSAWIVRLSSVRYTTRGRIRCRRHSCLRFASPPTLVPRDHPGTLECVNLIDAERAVGSSRWAKIIQASSNSAIVTTRSSGWTLMETPDVELTLMQLLGQCLSGSGVDQRHLDARAVSAQCASGSASR